MKTREIDTLIQDVRDPSLAQFIQELLTCARWAISDHARTTIFAVISQILHHEAKSFTESRTLPGSVLATKVGKLPTGPVYSICNEILATGSKHIEEFTGKTVLALIKAEFPRLPPEKKLGKREVLHNREAGVIRLRRANKPPWTP